MLVLENNPIDDNTTGPMDTITQKQSGKRKVKVKKKSAVVSNYAVKPSFYVANLFLLPFYLQKENYRFFEHFTLILTIKIEINNTPQIVDCESQNIHEYNSSSTK